MNQVELQLFPGGVLVIVCVLVISVVTSAHALLYKRDTRSAALWVAFIWLSPVIGALAYYVLGVNRIHRQAVSIRPTTPRPGADSAQPPVVVRHIESALPPESYHLSDLARLVTQIVDRPLLQGNQVEPLLDGDTAFPAMLEAIRNARTSVSLATYIFDNDPTGREFVEALTGAVRRGVEVRVLVDDVGLHYSWPSILRPLLRAGVPVGRFLPRLIFLRFAALNLRNHRKILVVDGRIGFTGGINIRQAHRLDSGSRNLVRDLHFRVTGPVVAHLQETFVADWAFCTGETLQGQAWFPQLEIAGHLLARGVSDGPDEDFEKLRWTILGALACARHRIQLLTPYFLPDQTLISALNLAALRGVEVDIVLPKHSNLPYVDWASASTWWQMLERDCRIWLTPAPFDHSKLLVVDSRWSLIGSANLDPRSLRLNFEFNVEIYGPTLARRLSELVEDRKRQARQVTLAEVLALPLAVRLRNGVARLFTPFL